MIRNATISDSEPIATALWDIWHQYKVRQIPSPMHRYASSEALAEDIRHDLDRWLVCEPAGFFSLIPAGDDKAYKRLQFPRRTMRIENFACLLSGEILSHQLRLLATHLPQPSILLVIPSSLRDIHWAALQAGFRQLGDGSLIVGAFVWLYLDRQDSHDAIQTKLRRAKIIA